MKMYLRAISNYFLYILFYTAVLFCGNRLEAQVMCQRAISYQSGDPQIGENYYCPEIQAFADDNVFIPYDEYGRLKVNFPYQVNLTYAVDQSGVFMGGWTYTGPCPTDNGINCGDIIYWILFKPAGTHNGTYGAPSGVIPISFTQDSHGFHSIVGGTPEFHVQASSASTSFAMSCPSLPTGYWFKASKTGPNPKDSDWSWLGYDGMPSDGYLKREKFTQCGASSSTFTIDSPGMPVTWSPSVSPKLSLAGSCVKNGDRIILSPQSSSVSYVRSQCVDHKWSAELTVLDHRTILESQFSVMIVELDSNGWEESSIELPITSQVFVITSPAMLGNVRSVLWTNNDPKVPISIKGACSGADGQQIEISAFYYDYQNQYRQMGSQRFNPPTREVPESMYS